ncbi:hypothetical protein GC170_20030 [bacterium]|nr:hypothetical protein [bacterium]
MSQGSVVSAGNTGKTEAASVPKPGVIRERVRKYYAFMSFVLLAFMFAGFRMFYLKGQAFPGRPLVPPIKWLLIVHGVSMTLWVALLVVQSMLIVRRQPLRHMKLGMIGAGLAVLIFFSGLLLSVKSMQLFPPGMTLWGMTARQFFVVPTISMLLFGAMVGAAIVYRRRPEIHKPMMLFATVDALGAASGRADFFNRYYEGAFVQDIFGPNLLILLVGACFVIGYRVIARGFDKWFVASYLIVLAVNVGMVRLGFTGAWESIAAVFVG